MEYTPSPVSLMKRRTGPSCTRAYAVSSVSAHDAVASNLAVARQHIHQEVGLLPAHARVLLHACAADMRLPKSERQRTPHTPTPAYIHHVRITWLPQTAALHAPHVLPVIHMLHVCFENWWAEDVSSTRGQVGAVPHPGKPGKHAMLQQTREGARPRPPAGGWRPRA